MNPALINPFQFDSTAPASFDDPAVDPATLATSAQIPAVAGLSSELAGVSMEFNPSPSDVPPTSLGTVGKEDQASNSELAEHPTISNGSKPVSSDVLTARSLGTGQENQASDSELLCVEPSSIRDLDAGRSGRTDCSPIDSIGRDPVDGADKAWSPGPTAVTGDNSACQSQDSIGERPAACDVRVGPSGAPTQERPLANSVWDGGVLYPLPPEMESSATSILSSPSQSSALVPATGAEPAVALEPTPVPGAAADIISLSDGAQFGSLPSGESEPSVTLAFAPSESSSCESQSASAFDRHAPVTSVGAVLPTAPAAFSGYYTNDIPEIFSGSEKLAATEYFSDYVARRTLPKVSPPLPVVQRDIETLINFEEMYDFILPPEPPLFLRRPMPSAFAPARTRSIIDALLKVAGLVRQ